MALTSTRGWGMNQGIEGDMVSGIEGPNGPCINGVPTVPPGVAPLKPQMQKKATSCDGSELVSFG